MLVRGRSKLSPRVPVTVGDAVRLPIQSGVLAGMTCAFGMRNLSDPRAGIAEAYRVLKPGGVFVVLEFYRPSTLVMQLFHAVYARFVPPTVGFVVSRDREAYAYLARSMKGFYARSEFEALGREVGFSEVGGEELTLGIASLVRMVKRPSEHAGGWARRPHGASWWASAARPARPTPGALLEVLRARGREQPARASSVVPRVRPRRCGPTSARAACAIWGLPVGGGRDYGAPFASGSSAPDAMVIIPASMSTVAARSPGHQRQPARTRAADVMLKERRKLVVVPRETPYSEIHLKNMLELTRAGARDHAGLPVVLRTTPGRGAAARHRDRAPLRSHRSRYPPDADVGARDMHVELEPTARGRSDSARPSRT